MIKWIIKKSIDNRLIVIFSSILLSVWGIWAIYNTPIDALPDISDVQVIIRTDYPGQAPQIVENQVTYPLTTTMLSVPGAKTVRGFSSFGESAVYIIFDDQTDLYWARSRVLEYLNQVQAKLPTGVVPMLGPDATGVGWIYEYALIDRTNNHDLAQLRSLQDWFLKFELSTIPNVAEVATVGGVVKEYQIVVDPLKLAQYNIQLSQIKQAITRGNKEVGGSVIELAEAEYMVRANGYLQSIQDIENIILKSSGQTIPIYLKDVARVQIGPEMRRGAAEFNGEGEVVGGVIILRSGENAREVIKLVKEKLTILQNSLPEGVEIVTVYDRSQLIDRAVDNLTDKLIEEFIAVAIVCVLFLWHVRSALVAIISLPLGLFIAFILMYYQGINANIMSLGGIAIAIGAMIDAAVVMIENAHKKLEQWHHENPNQNISRQVHWKVICDASVEVGPALFISLLIITLSFIPVLSLEGQEGKLFSPMVFTKNYSMAAAAVLSIIVIPILMGFWIRGNIPKENANPLNRFLIKIYSQLIYIVLRRAKLMLIISMLALTSIIWPLNRIGSEFLPRIDEGDLLYMPSTLPSVSSAQVTHILQITDKLIKTIPEVDTVFGKVGKAETATDSAPMEMIETTIRLKPEEEWRKGMTLDNLIQELDSTVRLPGIANLWVPPIRSRIDMLSTGVKSPIGIKVSGTDLEEINLIAKQIEVEAKNVSGVVSALAERLTGGRYIDININREKSARYGMNIDDIQLFVTTAIGGQMIGRTTEGIANYPINLRYPQDYRNSLDNLKRLPILTANGEYITMNDVANIQIQSGTPMIKTENARPASWVYIDARGRDMLSVVKDLQTVINRNIKLKPGVSVYYTGQFELLERANHRLQMMIPITLLIIFVLLYLAFRRIDDAFLIITSIPFALIGGFWLIYLQGYHFSVATGAGFIALAGVSAEFGVVMLLYLRNAIDEALQVKGKLALSDDELDKAIYQGAVMRVRPKAMTVAVIIAGLVPILLGTGTGSEVMTRIATPMVGGMITAPLLSMFVIPAAYKIMQRRRFQKIK